MIHYSSYQQTYTHTMSESSAILQRSYLKNLYKRIKHPREEYREMYNLPVGKKKKNRKCLKCYKRHQRECPRVLLKNTICSSSNSKIKITHFDQLKRFMGQVVRVSSPRRYINNGNRDFYGYVDAYTSNWEKGGVGPQLKRLIKMGDGCGNCALLEGDIEQNKLEMAHIDEVEAAWIREGIRDNTYEFEYVYQEGGIPKHYPIHPQYEPPTNVIHRPTYGSSQPTILVPYELRPIIPSL